VITPRDRRAVAAGYDHGAAGYDERHGDAKGRARARVIDRTIIAAVPRDATVLEIGVGTGRLLAPLHARHKLGVDVSAAMLAQARRRGLAVARADGHDLPVRTGAIDAVIAGKGSLRYLDPPRVLAEVARVLPVGGVLAFDLYPRRTWSRRPLPPPDPSLWQPASLAELTTTLTDHGFVVERIVAVRAIRVWPYVLRVPIAWADRGPAPLWTHVAVVARRR
jgi:SAM-dependent methyltransferase